MTVTKDHDHVIRIPTTPAVDPAKVDACSIAQQWIEGLESQLVDSHSTLLDLFHQDSWWRDMLVMEWEFRTVKGLTRIEPFVSQNQTRVQLSHLSLQKEGKGQPAIEIPVKGVTWITAMFFFETRVGRGSGVMYLTQATADGPWKAYSVYVALQELKDMQEQIGSRRPEGTIESMPGSFSQGTWLERRTKEVEFLEHEPTVLIVGAGQSGLNVAARLHSLGISCLIVEKNERVGDNWRKRYRTLVTHDHAETCHMAYLPFPKNWPKYSSKDKLADWLEAYATIMELNIWCNSEVQAAQYDKSTTQWSVSIVRDGEKRTLQARHIVWCTGHLGLPRVPTFPGQSDYQGTVYHTSEHTDARQHAPKGKHVVVVGTGNSGHDIAQDFYEQGARVTLLQRGPTYVLTEKNGLPLLPENLGIEDVLDKTPTEELDVLSESLPWPVTLALCVDLTKRISAADKDTLSGLEEAGFRLDFGHDGAGILRHIVSKGGGYYIDFGCSQLIIDRKIQLKSCPEGIAGFNQQGLLLGDGSHLDADIVVLATGYENMRDSVRRILGEGVANRCNDVWGLDEDGEIKTIWRPSGHPGFWFMGGSLSLCRIYSRFVALQIAATEAGITL
ncbi:flavin-containing monooxygenase [Penicillium fimorum]|uniref:Flavin-containing monooxygenase n=1 Tax=Penicillium fimorum TaxID=1882269 RepID=A0A9X0CBH8_9EURO|nr:flavin-containing monooxygenase [Penicillium fimorum]